MNTTDRISIITELAKRDTNIGKTAMMKFLYLLQTIYSVPLGYDFEIYTYGPYSQAVMSDIEFADYTGSIHISSVEYPNGLNGYQINATDSGKDMVSKNQHVIDSYNEAIKSVVGFFSQRSAKELELYSTIVFVSSSFDKNGWDESQEEICSTVKQIKPYFTVEMISSAYGDLKSHSFIKP